MVATLLNERGAHTTLCCLSMLLFSSCKICALRLLRGTAHHCVNANSSAVSFQMAFILQILDMECPVTTAAVTPDVRFHS